MAALLRALINRVLSSLSICSSFCRPQMTVLKSALMTRLGSWTIPKEAATAISHVNGLEETDDLIAVALNLPIETAIELFLEERNKQQDSKGRRASPVSLEDLASELHLLNGLRTWNSTTVQVVGRNVLKESFLDLCLLQDVALPSAHRPLLLKIVSKHVKALTQARTESKVQQVYVRLFEELEVAVSREASEMHPCYQCHDTSAKGFLKSPVAKVDFTFTCGPRVTWSDVIWLAEVKSSLDDKGQYEEAVGKASDRAQMLFKMQPERKWVIVAVLGSSSLEILRLSRYPDQDRIKRTGLMTLTEDNKAQDPIGSHAARSLLQLFFAAKQDFDFKTPFLPPPFTLKKRKPLDACTLDNFECLRPLGQEINSRSAYKAIMKSGKFPAGTPVVVKFGKMEAIETEVSVLELLSTHNVPSTARLHCSGEAPGIGSCLVIGPVGDLIGVTEITPVQVAQVAVDVATTIISLGNAGILHCDVSTGNVLVTADGRGLLVDYGSSLHGTAVGSRRVTGTVLFSAFSVLWGDPNTVSSDLESLFYTLLSIVCDGEVPGCREASSTRVAAYRMAAMFQPREFKDRVLSKVPLEFRPLIEGLRNLFFKDLPAPSSGHSYVKNIDPTSYLAVCQAFLDSFPPPPSPPLPPPPSPPLPTSSFPTSRERPREAFYNTTRSKVLHRYRRA